MNPLAFILGNGLLSGSGYGSVLEMIEREGIHVAEQFFHGKASDLVNASAEKVAAKMRAEKWKVGNPYPKHPGRIIQPPDMTHDIFFRETALFIPRGGIFKDFVRDATDHAIGPALLPTVPTGDVDAAWSAQAGLAGVDYWFSKLP